MRSNGNAEESNNFNALNVYFICHVTALYKNISFDVSDQRCKKVFGASLSKFINFTHDHIDLKLT